MDPCCCEGDCLVFLDCFDRNDCQNNPTATIGNGWTKDKTGTWTLEAVDDDDGADCPCSLTEAGTEDSQIINTQKTLTGAQWMEVELHAGPNSSQDASTIAAGSIFQIKANYEDTNNYVYLEIREHEFSFHEAGGGQLGATEPVGWNDNGEEGLAWAISVDSGGVFTAGPNLMESNTANRCFDYNPQGKHAGVGNGSFEVEIKFNKFTLEQHKDTFDQCHTGCCRRCGSKCIGDTLIVDASSGICCINGESLTLTRTPHFCEGEGDANQWPVTSPLGTPAIVGCWAPACTAFNPNLKWLMKIECVNPKASPAWKGWALTTANEGDEGCTADQQSYEPIAGSCKPFYLLFRFDIWGDQGSAGRQVCDDPEDQGLVYFEVTEP